MTKYSEMQADIKNNYNKVKQSIPSGVKLIAVSKTRTLEEIKLVSECGCRDFGENKAQELCRKYEELPDLNWHFIGALQKNKIRLLVGKVCLIHSVDSFELAAEINRRAMSEKIVQDILIQVNPANEVQKRGISPAALRELVNKIKDSLPSVNIRGLMFIAPKSDDPNVLRSYFREMKTLNDGLGLEFLSMGMSGDYNIAIEEGATMVRIGSSIFGERDYKEAQQ